MRPGRTEAKGQALHKSNGSGFLLSLSTHENQPEIVCRPLSLQLVMQCQLISPFLLVCHPSTHPSAHPPRCLIGMIPGTELCLGNMIGSNTNMGPAHDNVKQERKFNPFYNEVK